MKANHNFFSNLAFNLAESHIGKTGTNPSVGCVVVKDNSVISTGVTSINGRPHAEFNALNKNISFKDSEMYLTLLSGTLIALVDSPYFPCPFGLPAPFLAPPFVIKMSFFYLRIVYSIQRNK